MLMGAISIMALNTVVEVEATLLVGCCEVL